MGAVWIYFTWILSSLHFVMLCPYLRGHSTFGGDSFRRWVLLHRPFNIWWQLGQKCLFRGLASMEVGWPQLLWILNLLQKSAGHTKFGHYSTSGSWVMSSVVQKTSNAHPPLTILTMIYDPHFHFGIFWVSNTQHPLPLPSRFNLIYINQTYWIKEQ